MDSFCCKYAEEVVKLLSVVDVVSIYQKGLHGAIDLWNLSLEQDEQVWRRFLLGVLHLDFLSCINCKL